MSENARKALTKLFLGIAHDLLREQGVVIEESPAEKAFGRVYKQPGMPALEDCRGWCDKIAAHFGHGQAVVMLQRYGVEKLSDLWIGSYRSFVDLASKAVQYNIPPSASWTEDDGVHTPNTA